MQENTQLMQVMKTQHDQVLSDIQADRDRLQDSLNDSNQRQEKLLTFVKSLSGNQIAIGNLNSDQRSFYHTIVPQPTGQPQAPPPQVSITGFFWKPPTPENLFFKLGDKDVHWSYAKQNRNFRNAIGSFRLKSNIDSDFVCGMKSTGQGLVTVSFVRSDDKTLRFDQIKQLGSSLNMQWMREIVSQDKQGYRVRFWDDSVKYVENANVPTDWIKKFQENRSAFAEPAPRAKKKRRGNDEPLSQQSSDDPKKAQLRLLKTQQTARMSSVRDGLAKMYKFCMNNKQHAELNETFTGITKLQSDVSKAINQIAGKTKVHTIQKLTETLNSYAYTAQTYAKKLSSYHSGFKSISEGW